MANPLPVRGVIYLENGSSNPLIMVPSVFLSLMSEVLLPCQLIFSRWRLDIHVYVPLYEHKYTYMHTQTYMPTYVYIREYVHTYTNIYIYTCIDVLIHIHTYTYMHVHTHAYTRHS